MTIFVPVAETPWSVFLPRVLPWAPGAPDPVAEDAIRRAAIEFCRRTRTWRVDLPAFLTTISGRTYTLTSPVADAVIQDVLSAQINGLPFPLKTPDALDIAWPGWQTATAYSPSCWYMDNERTMRVVAIPSLAGDSITARVSLKPTITAAGLDNTVYEEHWQAIADGALGELLSQPDESWTNDVKAGDRRMKFEKAIREARNRARKAYSSGGAFAAKPREYGY